MAWPEVALVDNMSPAGTTVISQPDFSIWAKPECWHFDALHRLAPYCTVLQLCCSCTGLYCSVLHCSVLHCTVLYHIVLHCTALYCAALHCSVLRCTALDSVMLYCTVLHCTAGKWQHGHQACGGGDVRRLEGCLPSRHEAHVRGCPRPA